MRVALVAVLGISFVGLCGCHTAQSPTPNCLQGPCCGISPIPTDLPENPHPCKKYCKVWVPPTYRMAPKMVKCKPSCTVCEPVPIKRMVAEDVCVKPRCVTPRRTCGTDCDENLVQVKPGGYRWERSGDGCWQYCHRPPEYKWCKRTVRENDILYCAETPPEYETVVRTVDDVRLRPKYVPAEYKIQWVKEVYTPGHWAWKEATGCDSGTPDHRCWTAPQRMGVECRGCGPRPPARDCGCPAVN